MFAQTKLLVPKTLPSKREAAISIPSETMPAKKTVKVNTRAIIQGKMDEMMGEKWNRQLSVLRGQTICKVVAQNDRDEG